MVNTKIKEYIEKNILPQYNDFEPSHNCDHVKTVIENSFNIVEELDLDVDLNMVYVIAAYHDIGMALGRDTHHLTSADIMFNDKQLDLWFSQQQKETMKEAIEDHRASGNEPPVNIYGKIIAEADRDIEPLRIIQRSVQFELNAHPGGTCEEIFEYVKNHIVEKYGEKGYLKLYLYSNKNTEGLKTLREWLRTGEIDEIIDRIYKGCDVIN